MAPRVERVCVRAGGWHDGEERRGERWYEEDSGEGLELGGGGGRKEVEVVV